MSYAWLGDHSYLTRSLLNTPGPSYLALLPTSPWKKKHRAGTRVDGKTNT